MSPQVTGSNHIPVMVHEALAALAVQPGGRYIDCTLGAGGHTAAILKKSSPGGQVLGLDADPEALERARARLGDYKDSILLVNENFVNLQSTCIKYDFFPVHGILFDLGLSSIQLAEGGRGFSFQQDAPLDMRYNPADRVTAADVVNTYSEAELAHIIKLYGEENFSRRIAHYIINARPLQTTRQLAELIEHAIGRRGKIHPATRTFQALRIEVNHELENLESALKQAIDLLGFEGRLVVISYHSLEDRIVKNVMRRESKNCICPPGTMICMCGHQATLRLIKKKVVIPTETEIKQNPRSRSAKLRVAERILPQDDCYGDSEVQYFLNEVESGEWRRSAVLEKLKMVFSMS